MKDRVFVGQDVSDALAVAAASLGLPQAELRYVVLDAGRPGERGLNATPARVAVLLGHGRAEPPRDVAAPEFADPRAGVRGTLRAVFEAGGLEVEAEIEDGEDALTVTLSGRDHEFFHGAEGRGEPLRALEHLLQRIYGAGLHPQVLRVSCEGYREARDRALAEEAHRLAAGVREDGEARVMDSLNAYERRVVHVALQDEPGIRTYSVGEGNERRLTIAPSAPPPSADGESHEPDA
jgi:spoIIIJ-associated protein